MLGVPSFPRGAPTKSQRLLPGSKPRQPNSTPTTRGLIFWCPFDSIDFVGTTARDRSVNKNNGTLVNTPTLGPGRLGTAGNFKRASSQSINVTSIPSSTSLTVSVRVFPTDLGTESNAEQIYWAGSNILADYGIAITVGNGFFNVYDISNNTFIVGTTPIPLNKWTTVAVTVASGGTEILYVNGRFETSRSIGAVTFQGNKHIATRGDGASPTLYNFEGRIDDIRVYNRVLSAAEIASLHTDPARDYYQPIDLIWAQLVALASVTTLNIVSVALGLTSKSDALRASLAAARSAWSLTSRADLVREILTEAKGALGWTARAVMLNAKALMTVAKVALSWTSRTDLVREILAEAKGALAWTARAVTLSAASALAVAKVGLSWTARSATVNAKTFLAVVRQNLVWTPRADLVREIIAEAKAALAWTARVISFGGAATLAIAKASLAFTARAATTPIRIIAARVNFVWSIQNARMLSALRMGSASFSWTARAVTYLGSVVLDVSSVAFSWIARALGDTASTGLEHDATNKYQVLIKANAPMWARRVQTQINDALQRIASDLKK